MTSLSERLGFDDSQRVAVLSCGGLGLSHAANAAILDALDRGVATTATLLVPAPWARAAAAAYRGQDVGVALTLNAEHDLYRWAPITHAPSLLDGDGGFPRTVDDLWEHADLDEVRRECRAQLERAIYWGIDVTHLAAHLEGFQLKPEFFDVVLDLAEEFRLPLRLPGASAERLAGFPFRELAANRGVISPDRVLDHETVAPRRFADLLADLEPGVTELCFRPAVDSPELRASCGDFGGRIADAELLADADAVRASLASADVCVVDYRRLRRLERP